ncbi:MAG: hypothetical protein IPM45_01055 [Acidimicrobiales bacterium]|nr:hypothetical protein [Acidimicrobiales bacterium]
MRPRMPGAGVDRPDGHVHHVELAGPTGKANLAGLCWHHHQRIHLDGFTLTDNADHRLEWRDQRGRLIGRPALRPDLHQPPDPRQSSWCLVERGRGAGQMIRLWWSFQYSSFSSRL